MFKPEEMGEVIDGHTLRFVRTVRHSPERVWRAITDEKELVAWMRYPVTFEAREGGRAQFFDEAERCIGKIFIFDPPRVLAYSFADARNAVHVADAEVDWAVRWDLEPAGDGGCRITFIQRRLPAAQLWGVGEGWHSFIDMLIAYLDGTIEARLAEASGDGIDLSGLSQYRTHVTEQLRAWSRSAAADARAATDAGQREAALAAIERLDLGVRQLSRIAFQEGAMPNYGLNDDSNPVAP